MAAIMLLMLLFLTLALGRHEHPQPNTEMLGQNPFHYNMMVDTSGYDPELDSYLWKGIEQNPNLFAKDESKTITYQLQSKLGKRAVNPLGPLIQIPCLFCGSLAKHDAGLSLSAFTVESMISRMKWSGRFGKCLFYGQRAGDKQKSPIGPSLSHYATDWSCLQFFLKGEIWRTIWQMWPYEKDGSTNLGSCKTGENYYCLNYNDPTNDCCWLNALLGDDKTKWQDNGLAYFRAMSRAMASTCEGEVFVMVDNKKMVLKQYAWAAAKGTPSIWLYDELPVLRDRYNRGIINKLTLIRVGDERRFDRTDYVLGKGREPTDGEDGDLGAPDADPNARMARSISEEDQRREDEITAMAARIAHALKKREAELILTGEMDKARNAEFNLRKRGVCPSGADQEVPGMDYFG